MHISSRFNTFYKSTRIFITWVGLCWISIGVLKASNFQHAYRLSYLPLTKRFASFYVSTSARLV